MGHFIINSAISGIVFGFLISLIPSIALLRFLLPKKKILYISNKYIQGGLLGFLSWLTLFIFFIKGEFPAGKEGGLISTRAYIFASMGFISNGIIAEALFKEQQKYNKQPEKYK